MTLEELKAAISKAEGDMWRAFNNYSLACISGVVRDTDVRYREADKSYQDAVKTLDQALAAQKEGEGK